MMNVQMILSQNLGNTSISLNRELLLMTRKYWSIIKRVSSRCVKILIK